VGFRSPKLHDDTQIATIGRELLEICDLALECERRILLDFRGVEFFSSAMIGKIVLLNKKAKASRIAMAVSNVAPEITSVFEATRLNRVFPIVDYDEQDDDDDDDEGPEALGCRVPKPAPPNIDSGCVELREERPDDERS
jgi:anti-sigma B factor antagonist